MRGRELLNPFNLYRKRERIWPRLKSHAQQLSVRMAARGLPLTRNDRRLLALRDRHKGQPAFIIASGPSLRVSDLDRLDPHISFACNKIYLAFDQTKWRPTYYSVMDVLVAQQNREIIETLQLAKIFFDDVKASFNNSNDIIWVRSIGQPNKTKFKFSANAWTGFYGGWTVIYSQLQLAYFMGIREVYFVGLDFSFSVPAATGETCEHGPIISSEGEQNHFDPRYRQRGERWTMPRLDLQYKAFECARDVFAAGGGMIYNASRSTALDVFPLVDFDKLCSQLPPQHKE